MRIAVILDNGGGEMDRAEINIDEEDDENTNLMIHEVIEDWVISVGDIIRVEALADVE